MEKPYKFKKSESFYIRDGWFEKAINSINELKTNIFYKNEGVKILGIGSNMVKSLKYWLFAANLVRQNGRDLELTELGDLLIKNDRYLETNFTWFLIHYNLVKNIIECPIFFGIFNFEFKSFTKNEAISELVSSFESQKHSYKKEYIEEDLNVFLKSYYNDNHNDNPEENYSCPLANLNLIIKKSDKYLKTRPNYNSLSYLVIYYVLQELYDTDSFIIEDSMFEKNSPYAIFNLDKNMYLQYLEEMKKNGLIIINKTAGLNTVYFEKRLTMEQIFGNYIGG